MQYFIFLLLVCFIIFLFTLFVLCRDDFVLFKKNVDMEKVFNVAFLVGLVGLFFSRVVYVILFFKPLFLHPLVFFLFPYFPGLSLPGGLLGGSLALLFFLKGKKYPEGRLFDFFILSATIAIIIGEIVMSIVLYVGTKQLAIAYIVDAVVLFLIFLFTFRVFKKHTLKEGGVGLFLMMLMSLLYIGTAFLQKFSDVSLLYKEIGTWSVLFLLSFILFLRQESFFSFFAKK
ncbi:MAG: prolipoprotein diacylglyceryl transferase [Candidatus Levybacteria bacterium]|nr:prolipoprotein diacylglyceryl transferase [Candidatus Levybacteria bacterium]